MSSDFSQAREMAGTQRGWQAWKVAEGEYHSEMDPISWPSILDIQKLNKNISLQIIEHLNR